VRARKRDAVERGLRKKGFALIQTQQKAKTRADHHYFYLYVGDRCTAMRTKTSRGHDVIVPNLLSEMTEQVHLSNPDFERLLDCPMSHEEYVSLLTKRGHL